MCVGGTPLGPGRMNRIGRRASSSVSSDEACVSVPEAELNRQTGGRCAETERIVLRGHETPPGNRERNSYRCGGPGAARNIWEAWEREGLAGGMGRGSVLPAWRVKGIYVCVYVRERERESPASCFWVTSSDRDLRADAGGALACLTRSLGRGPNPVLGPWPGQFLPTRSWWWHAGNQQEDRSGPQRGGKQEGGPAAVVGTEAGKEQKAEPQGLWGSQWGRRGCSLVGGV